MNPKTQPVVVAEPAAWRITDGEGSFEYRDDLPEAASIAWSARYGRKWEPLYDASALAAQEVQPPSAEPVAWQMRTFNDDGTLTEPRWEGWYQCEKPIEATLTREKNLGIRREYRGLYAAPIPPMREGEPSDEREAFEAHWYDFYHSGSIKARADGRYFGEPVNRAWDAWQARAVLIAPVRESAPNKPDAEDVEGNLLYEVRRDAARWRALPAFIEDHQIDYVQLLLDVDGYIALPPAAAPPMREGEPTVTRDEAIRVAKEIGLIGWISDDGKYFEWVETQKPSLQLVAFAQRFAALTAPVRQPDESELPPLPFTTKPDCYTADDMHKYALYGISHVALTAPVRPLDKSEVKRIATLMGWTPPGMQPPMREGEPVDIILLCPACGLQHVDAPETFNRHLTATTGGWNNPPHRSHLCHGCGHIWRPADVPTNGVAAIKTNGKADSAAPVRQPDWKAAFEQEALKFQAETLRASRLHAALDAMVEQFINEGHEGHEVGTKRCDRCRLVREAKAVMSAALHQSEVGK